MKKNKVFIISLHKTGTTSLAYFLEKLGYLVTGPDTHLFEKAMKKDYREIDSFLKNYDAFQDDPWYMIYSYLYEQYPNAKFVFLNRDSNSWIKSVQKFYGKDKFNNKVRNNFYGHANTIENKELYLKKYEQHNLEIKRFFKDKNNFIEIDIRKNHDAIRLQTFLNENIKFKTFPRKNVTPKNEFQTFKKKLRIFVLNWFGFKKLLKKELKKRLSQKSYLGLRTKTRLFRAKLRVFKNKFIF